MTTIAYRDGTLAADSQVNYDSYRNGTINKLHILEMKGGGVVAIGLAGFTHLFQPMIEWIEDGAEPENVFRSIATPSNISCLMLNSEGRLFEYYGGYFVEVFSDYHAIGSGAFFALGAMAHKASAPEAVLAASKHDNSTNNQIMVVSVDDLFKQTSS